MKKRAMKKWIPKDTCYCYYVDNKHKFKRCKWLSFNKTKDEQLSGFCKFLNSGDWFKNGTSLLFDECKECRWHHDGKLYYLRSAKKEGRRNLRIERKNKK